MIMQIIKKITQIGLITVLILGFVGYGFAQEKGKLVSQKTVMKEIQGKVSAISNNFIAVVYAENKEKGSEEEIALPIAKDVNLEHVKSLHQIEAGDRVKVQYEEVQEGGKVIERKAKVITFLGPARKGEKLLEYLKPVVKGGTMVWEEREKSKVAW